jgi:hypothetical protein
MRKLSREYGYSALGVYIGLLVLDFPFCYLAVQYMGAERIGRYEHVIMERLKDIVRVPFPDAFAKGDEKMESDVAKEVEEEETAEEQGGASKLFVDSAERFDLLILGNSCLDEARPRLCYS